MWTRRRIIARVAGLTMALGASGLAPAACEEAPLSAIDWLSQGLGAPPASALPDPESVSLPRTDLPGGKIEVTPIAQPSPEAVGLLPVSVTGLPRDLWARSDAGDLARRLADFRPDMLPAARRLLFVLLLAELDPPAGEGHEARLLLARVDALLRFGAVEQAQALLMRAGPRNRALVSRMFDAALLTGAEDVACAEIAAAPALAPGLAARVFCLARAGDVAAADLLLAAGRALGELSVYEDALLARFLHPEAFEGLPPLAPPETMTPLIFRLFEAIGEPLPTANLPLAYAHADLRPVAGWRAQIEAAERLARAGALPANRLLGLWTERRPAASGGIWDRVAALQVFDAAVTDRDLGRIEASLPPAWAQMRRAGLEPVFAEIYALPLEHLPLSGEAEQIRFTLGMLSDRYERYARARTSPPEAGDALLAAIATGEMPDTISSPDPFATAVFKAFRARQAPARLEGLIRSGRLGEALLRALQLVEAGADGDTAALADGLATLRAVGLEGAARRAALEVLILERRG